jgi:endoglucanase
MLAGALAVSVILGACADEAGVAPVSGGASDDAARAAARRFLDTYVEPDGRVVRRDQGGDTVSEGQAYAMLLAAAIGDREAFDRAWSWAQGHLRRDDGLLSWHWRDGRVQDVQSAADADLDAARALVVAARRFEDDTYLTQARRLGAAILEHETVDSSHGPVLVAGPWAATPPATVNPSYFSPRAFGALGDATGEEAWQEADEAAAALVEDLLEGAALPPDWATLADDGSITPAPPPGSGADPRYGYDAVRVPLRFAEACDDRVRRIAARMWETLRRARDEGRLAPVLGLDGSPRSEGEHPAALVGAGAAAHAAGEADAAAALLDEAEALDRRQPGYYGAGLVALGRVVLQTELLGAC